MKKSQLLTYIEGLNDDLMELDSLFGALQADHHNRINENDARIAEAEDTITALCTRGDNHVKWLDGIEERLEELEHKAAVITPTLPPYPYPWAKREPQPERFGTGSTFPIRPQAWNY